MIAEDLLNIMPPTTTIPTSSRSTVRTQVSQDTAAASSQGGRQTKRYSSQRQRNPPEAGYPDNKGGPMAPDIPPPDNRHRGSYYNPGEEAASVLLHCIIKSLVIPLFVAYSHPQGPPNRGSQRGRSPQGGPPRGHPPRGGPGPRGNASPRGGPIPRGPPGSGGRGSPRGHAPSQGRMRGPAPVMFPGATGPRGPRQSPPHTVTSFAPPHGMMQGGLQAPMASMPYTIPGPWFSHYHSLSFHYKLSNEWPPNSPICEFNPFHFCNFQWAPRSRMRLSILSQLSP